MSSSLDTLIANLSGRRLALLTGAGISTDSGIPDYRGPSASARVRSPIQHRAFVGQAHTRARYWARSVLGWPRFKAFAPNPAHLALAHLETAGLLEGLITQNVDRLHQKAGHGQVLELHGSLFAARCLACGATEPRDALQARLLELNPGAGDWAHTLAPDGDADIPEAAVEDFVVPGCVACGGVLKPDVVFFGDNVPKPRVEEAFSIVDRAQALLVVGSSLTVYSGYRFALRAAERGVPLCIVNLGPTRADAIATVKVEAPCGPLLPALTAALSGATG